jgi:RNA polymerase sigma factor (sigma-70 family)
VTSNPAPEGFEDFFRQSYRDLVKNAMLAGATREEAEDAASRTLLEMLQKWPIQGYPLRYARKAVVSNFIKDKTRGNQRVARRLIELGHVTADESVEEIGLTAFEHDSWVTDVLDELPEAQQEVMRRIASGLSYEEIVDTLGISKDAVRRRLCDARARLVMILNRNGEFKQPDASEVRSSRKRPHD